MFATIADSVVNGLLGASGWPVYSVIGVLAFAEAAAFVGLVLPGETALLIGGVLAGRQQIGLVPLLLVAIAAAVAGDSVGYLVGSRFGPTLRQTRLGRLIRPEHWARAEDFVSRRGVWAVIAGRWVGVLRALVPTVAGMTRMRYRSFAIANAVGGVAWAVIVVLLGYSAGASFTNVQSLLGRASLVLTSLTVVAAAAAWIVSRRRAHSAAATREHGGVQPTHSPTDTAAMEHVSAPSSDAMVTRWP